MPASATHFFIQICNLVYNFQNYYSSSSFVQRRLKTLLLFHYFHSVCIICTGIYHDDICARA